MQALNPDWSLIYLISEWGIRLVMLAVVPLRRTPQAASAWLLLILFLPWVGLVLYWVVGNSAMPGWRKARTRRFTSAMRPVATRLASLPEFRIPVLPPRQQPVAALAQRLGRLPPWGGNGVTFLVDYDASLAHLVEDIDAARHHVHLLYYIFAVDEATRPILAALRRAAGRGVACRVLVDAMGSRSHLDALAEELEGAGVELEQMLPYGLFRTYRTRVDLRNHRKIAVIDGRIGHTGSQNLVSATYAADIIYEELVVRLEGPSVLQLQVVFAADWYLETGQVLEDAAFYPVPDRQGAQVVQALPSGPLFETETIQRLVVSLIYAARERVVITTPYFIPDDALLQALETAVLRGVEVSLIVSRRMDQLLVGLAQESYYEELLGTGIRIYRYETRFLHAKHLSCDDEVVLIGSSNMDIRSFQLNDEISLLVYDRENALRLRREQERTIAEATPLTAEAWEERSRARWLAQSLARLVSPLL